MEFWEERIGELLKQLDTATRREYKQINSWDVIRDEESICFKAEMLLPEVDDTQEVEIFVNMSEEKWCTLQLGCYIDGTLRQGIDTNHRSIRIGKKKNETILIEFQGYFLDCNLPDQMCATVNILEKRIEKYYYDVLVPYEIMKLLDKEDSSYLILLSCLQESLQKLDLRRLYSNMFYDSIKAADENLQNTLYEKYANEKKETIYCVGHTHIDVAWLWTLLTTRHKVGRSFATVLKLMEEYPEYLFMSSQPQLYEYIKIDYPEIYAQISRRVAEQRWETEGGMYVEADCNLTSGEGLIRQFLYGKEFFKKEFGNENIILWLPDVFGYSAALPQIMQKCGIKYFMTTKISWNETNKMPYDTFYWEGIDGTRILTHFIPTRDYNSNRTSITNKEYTTSFSTNYNGYIVPSQMKGAWQRYQQKNLNKEVLVSFGYGDGGGGPTRQMLETQRRLKYGLPGCPRTHMATAQEFFSTLECDIKDKQVPIWSGELYLEYHRGTYTSMAKNKEYNRNCGYKILNAEMLWLFCGNYPSKRFREIWKVLLKNQFHDILPGSAIKEVYDESWIEYEEVDRELNLLFQEGYAYLAEVYKLQNRKLLLCNYSGCESGNLIKVKQREWEKLDNMDKTDDVQYTWDGDVLLKYDKLAPKSINIYCPTKIEPAKTMQISLNCVENDYYTVSFGALGEIESLVIKNSKRDLIKGYGNVFMVYEDKPHNYDNWNLYHYYTEKSWKITDLVKSEVLEKGPYRYAISFTYRYLSSTIREIMYFYPDSPKIDMEFDLDWQEDQAFLKLLFPINLNTHEATFDIQYGNVKRGTTQNTSWDCARFEVCYQRWFDIAECDCGISFLSNYKAGVSITDNIVGLSLLKCGRYPNPEADRGHHHFLHSIIPHDGDWRASKIEQQAELLNNPICAKVTENERGNNETGIKMLQLIRTNADNVSLDVIKRAQHSEACIVRLHEFYNRYSLVNLDIHKAVEKVWLCDMLENEIEELNIEDNSCLLNLKPFEIVTLKLIIAGDWRKEYETI